MSYRQLIQEQRYRIGAYLRIRIKRSEIARMINVGRSTVWREIKRNSTPHRYNPSRAIGLTRENMIGLIPASPTDSMAFPLKPKGGGLNHIVHAAPFCRHFGIIIDRTEPFDEPLLDDQGILRLNLRKTRDASNRRKRNSE
jgi:hypothetical protein